jgi:hypothetical protein
MSSGDTLNHDVQSCLLQSAAAAARLSVNRCSCPAVRLLQFVTGSKISAAPAITFLWVKTFPLAIYGPLVLPLLIVFIITVSGPCQQPSWQLEAR